MKEKVINEEEMVEKIEKLCAEAKRCEKRIAEIREELIVLSETFPRKTVLLSVNTSNFEITKTPMSK